MPPTSQILKDLDAAPAGPVEFGAVFGAMGSRAHALALLLLALPDTLPLPVPSTSTILGVPLVIVAAHLAMFGEASPLPERVARLKVPRPVIHTLARYGSPLLLALERVSRPRLAILLVSDNALGLICLYISVLLLLPIPLMNAAPAICLVAITLGMVQRDGILVAAGIVGTIAMTASVGFLVEWIAVRLSGS